MGWTHYWELAKISKHSTRPATAIGNMAIILRHSPVPLAGGDGTGKPSISKKEIVFNGKAPDDYETFWFPGEPGFNFCKTAQKPYDLIVTACLAVAKDVYGPEITVTSDGNASDWAAGVELASEVLEREIRNPIGGGGMDGVESGTRFVLLDNGGKTADRYTIFDSQPDEYGNHQFGAFNEHPYHPQGFGQHGEVPHRAYEEHKRDRFRSLGKRIKLGALGPDAQRFAKSFMEDSLQADDRRRILAGRR